MMTEWIFAFDGEIPVLISRDSLRIWIIIRAKQLIIKDWAHDYDIIKLV